MTLINFLHYEIPVSLYFIEVELCVIAKSELHKVAWNRYTRIPIVKIPMFHEELLGNILNM